MTTVAVEIGESHAEVTGLTIDEASDLVDLTDRPSHLAKCRECDVRVTYRPTASGAGFTVLKHSLADPEANFGISAAGLPLCPNGHGEMEIADDQLLPVAEAFEQVAGELAEDGPVQRSLPGIIEFNKAGAYDDLEGMFVRRDRAKRLEEQDHERYKTSKKERELLDETIVKAGLEFRRRRLEKTEGGEAGASPAPLVGRCRFEELHPGVPCPMPHDGLAAEHLTSEAHGCEAQDLLAKQEIADCVAQLAALNIIVTPEVLGALAIEDLSTVEAWALDATQNPERREELLKSLPKGLGRPHVAGDLGKNSDQSVTYQECSVCGGSFTTAEPYYAGMLIGTDCPGKDPGHRYPEKKKRKARKAKE